MTHFYYHWKNRPAAGEFRIGVSLHGHTSRSEESLAFLPGAIQNMIILPSVMRWAERRHWRKWKESFDYSRGYWTSPVSPRAAYELETKQIVSEGLKPLVSLTDHDEISARKELGDDVPISLEWTMPYKTAIFHVGIHNLPAQKAESLLEVFRSYTARPDPDRLGGILADAHAIPDTLIILNHPLSDQGRIGHEIHISMVEDFLANHKHLIDALEINALQPWDMNRRVAAIAHDVGLPMLAGGDRHGFEPNGAINLTNATSFPEFSHEIRSHKANAIFFMPQSREPLAIRYAENIRMIMDYYPDQGNRAAWHDRVFYRCPDGVTRSLTQMVGKRFHALDLTSAVVGLLGFTVDQFVKPIAPMFVSSKKEILT